MLFFLYGEDSYRSTQKLKEIIERYKKVHKSGLNLVRVNIESQGVCSLKENVETFSMFNEKKLIIVENFLTKEKNKKEIIEYLEKSEISKNKDVIIVLFSAGSLKSNDAFLKIANKLAKCQEFRPLSQSQLNSWVKAEVEKNNVKITHDAMLKLILFCGYDLWLLSQEIKKLSDHSKEITPELVELLVKSKIDSNIFKTVEALAKKDKKNALRLTISQLQSGDDPLYVLHMFVYEFRNLLKIRSLMDKGVHPGDYVKLTRLHPYVVRKLTAQALNFNIYQLKKIYHNLFKVDLAVKTGKIEPRIALEMFVMGL